MTLFIENYGLLIHYTTCLYILNRFDDNYNQNFNLFKQKTRRPFKNGCLASLYCHHEISKLRNAVSP